MITRTEIRCGNDKLGKVLLMGIYGGAICNHWMATGFIDDKTIWTKVELVSKKIVEGDKVYYTTEYVAAEK
jgi:hypothetical protein